MRELISFCWRSISNRGQFVAYLVASFGKVLATAATPLLAGILINVALSPASGVRDLFLPCVVLACAGVASALLGYGATLLYTYLQADSSFELELTATRHIQHLRPAFSSRASMLATGASASTRTPTRSPSSSSCR